MALAPQTTANFASFIGTPDSNTVYQKLEFGFKAIAVKIIVGAGATLEVSLNGTDVALTLVTGQYNFHGLIVNKLFVRDILVIPAGTSQVLAWTD
jgi:hypothetical protein